jgi:hypothetical protein
VIAFVPIARYKVEYQVASGRPFSTFEKLLLRAIDGGCNTLGSLAEMFKVHRRLVIEGLVTLMQAGWVSIAVGSDEFVLSQSGKLACEGSTGLPPTIIVSDRSQTIVVEKVTGQIARNGAVDFYARGKLKELWDSGVPIRKQDISNIVDPGMVAPLLPHQSTEWIRWIGPISVLSDNAAFAVVDVDTLNGRLTGLPKAWEPLLLPDLLDQVGKREADLVSAGIAIDDRELRQLVRGVGEFADDEILDDELSWQWLSLRDGDVLTSPDHHNEARDALFRDARAHIAIASAQLSLVGAQALIPQLTDALKRGLAISLLLGELPAKENAGPRGAFELLKKLEYDSGRGAYSGRLSLSSQSTGCQTNIIVADTDDGTRAILGSFAWTSDRIGEGNRHLSVCLRDAWVVGHLCEILADLSAADEKLRLGSGFVRLKNAAGDLRSQLPSKDATPPAGAVKARLLLDRSQQAAMREAIVGANKSVIISTTDLAALSALGALKWLLEPSERIGTSIKIKYGFPAETDAGKVPLAETLLKNGVKLAFSAGECGDWILADDDALVAFCCKSRMPPRRRPYASSIGIAIKGPEMTRVSGVAAV